MRFCLAALCIIVAAQRGWAADPPNIVLILTDDQGYGDLSLHGNPHVKTPVIDAFAKKGTQFDRFFVSPVCSPTRASLLTGRYSLRTGVWGVTHGKEAMRLGEVTLAQLLKSAGYRTACIGKWHNGEQYPYTPTGRGFDEFFGFHNGHWNNYFDADLLRGSQFVKTKGYIADVLTDAACKFMEENQKKPFFCYLAYNTPHSPFQVPDQYFNRFKHLSPELASIYGMVENLDYNVGRVLTKLEELGLRDNTIVIFVTDNGPSSDRFNAGMRGRKGSVHEGGIRVPFFVQWPARFPQPRTIPQIAAHIDVLPTLLELCKVPAPKNVQIDGKSLVPLLEGKSAAWKERLLFAHQFRPQVGMFPGSVRSQKHRAVNEGKGWQLYDMEVDPAQGKDIAKSSPEILQALRKEYEAWFKDVSREGFVRFAIPVGHDEENPVTLHAPQAQFEGLHFYAGPGFANDWLTGWSKTGKVWWEIDVAKAGKYKATISYACAAEDAGATIALNIAKQTRETQVAAAPGKFLPLPHRDGGKKTYINRVWSTLDLGIVMLPAGRTTATLTATNVPGEQVMELKDLRLERIE